MIECKSLTSRLGSAYTALSEQFHETWIRKSKFWKLFFVIFLQNNQVIGDAEHDAERNNFDQIAKLGGRNLIFDSYIKSQ